MGFSLKEIQQQLSSENLKEIVTLLEHRDNLIGEQIGKLKSQRKAVQRTIRSFERYQNAPPDGYIVLEYLEKRQMYCIDSKFIFFDNSVNCV